MDFDTTTEEFTSDQFYLTTISAFPAIAQSNLSLNITNNAVKTQLLLYDILIPAIGTLIIILNLSVVISSGLILKKGQQPRSTYLFLGNIAMADLVTGFAVLFGQMYPKADRSHTVCAIQLGMIVSSTLASVFSVGLIAVDRFLYIIHGLQYQQWVYPTRARLLIVGAWTIGLVIGFAPLFGWYGNTNNGRICWFILLAPRELILLTVLSGMVPILTVLTLYSIVLYHAIRKIMHLQTPDAAHNLRIFRGGAQAATTPEPPKGFFARIFKKGPSDKVKAPSKWKAIKVVLFTTLSFILTWCPYFITCIVYVYQCENISTPRCKTMRILIASPLAILGFMNSLLNPIIYAWWHKGFRSFIRRKIYAFKLRRQREEDFSGNSKVTRCATQTSSSFNSKTNMSQLSGELVEIEPGSEKTRL